ncbi:uncharacterized protein LOC120252876 [Dioscorea cayenensis subsp. rotundata]|uniref:Uncharacterized protein LOC120252876 n=1 Tax=Dioscorea cayennensis subsp. rotundata TaxID=55577 RepID=A0AB40AQB1_DIOCR|nr:uncharacterized protein LOC120252876 [Dioscorea cayenensis subsp. rotundata]
MSSSFAGEQMPIAAAIPRALLPFGRRQLSPSLASRPRFSSPTPFYLLALAPKPPRFPFLVASAAASFDDLDADGESQLRSSKKAILSNLIHEIEPLDVSLIQKDVPPNTIDAMKRTISSMLGLLPSDQFGVLVEAFWDPLFKLLVSSMMTGYTLRNAEYRLCLERSLGVCEELPDSQTLENTADDDQITTPDGTLTTIKVSEEQELLCNSVKNEEESVCSSVGVEGLGEMTPEAQEYILYMQSRLSSMEKELHDIKRKNAALQMQHFVGEEENELLEYLRSLQPEKVVELSEPTCPGLQESINSVAHGLLATLSPKIHTKAPLQSENTTSTSTLNIGKDDCPELVENTSLQFQPLISISRDYLARLLFWCMLLGHYLRGLEYRLELVQILRISGNVELISQDSDCVS